MNRSSLWHVILHVKLSTLLHLVVPLLYKTTCFMLCIYLLLFHKQFLTISNHISRHKLQFYLNNELHNKTMYYNQICSTWYLQHNTVRKAMQWEVFLGQFDVDDPLVAPGCGQLLGHYHHVLFCKQLLTFPDQELLIEVFQIFLPT